MDEPKIEPLMSRADVARYLNISLRKLDSMREEGTLVGFWVGGQWRIKRAEVEAYLESNPASAELQAAEVVA